VHKICSGNLLKICSDKFVDNLSKLHRPQLMQSYIMSLTNHCTQRSLTSSQH